MGRAVFGIASTYVQAEAIVEALKQEGFANTNISVVFPDKHGTQDFAHEKHTKAPQGTVAGAGGGGTIGGVLGWLAGIGSLTIPGVGPLLAAGPVMAALGGAAIGSAVGGFVGALVGMGIPEYAAKRYEGKVRDGNILISVHLENADDTERAEKVFKRSAAHDISSTSETSIKGSTGTLPHPGLA